MVHIIKTPVLLTLLTNQDGLCSKQEQLEFFNKVIAPGIEEYHLQNARKAVQPILKATVPLHALSKTEAELYFDQKMLEQFWINWHKTPKSWDA